MENKVAIVCLAIGCFLAGSAIGQFESVDRDGYTFSVSQVKLPWAQAKEECAKIGQKLLSVENPTKDDLLVQLFVEQRNNNVTLAGNSWIDAHEVREGVWVWNDLGKPTYHTRWFMDGQPDDTSNLNCVYIAASAYLYWRDANCSSFQYFVCEGQTQATFRKTPLLDVYELTD